jgi:hypothetical protein
MSTTITEQVTLETTTCWKCGITHAVPSHFLKSRQQDKQTFYCPNGHGGAFTESESERLRKQLEAAQREASAAKTREQSEREQRWAAEADRDKAIRANSRLKKRAAAGVCPCCNRTFENLQRHMHTKHPDFSK